MLNRTPHRKSFTGSKDRNACKRLIMPLVDWACFDTPSEAVMIISLDFPSECHRFCPARFKSGFWDKKVLQMIAHDSFQ